MDTTKTTTHLGICAGYGGIELGLKRVIPNLRSVALCEIEAFACANLVAKMEAGLMESAPIWTDLKSFPWESFRDRVDILTGGYPCQPFSAAGKRLGTEDPRHLWPYIAGGIRILRPKLCFFENVEGHISLGLREVIGELESMGYKVSWGIFSAREVGAPHQRKRVFILAYDQSLGIQGCGAGWLQETRPYAGQGIPVRGGNAGCCELANAGRIEPQGWCGAADRQQSGERRIPRGEPAPCHDQVWPSRPGKLVDPEHLGHNAAEIDGGHPASADPRWAQESQVYRQSSGGCSPIWPSRPGEPQHAWEPPRVVVDAKSQRAGQRSELRSEECGSGSALPRDIEQPGEGTLANNHRPHAGHGEQWPERTFGDLSGGCGEGSGNMANSNRNEPSEGRGDNGEVPQIPAGEWTDECATLSGGEGELSGEIMANSVIVGRRGRDHGDAGGLRGEIQVEGSCGGRAEAMGNASQREDHGRESRDMGQTAGEGRCGDYAADGTSEGMGNWQAQPSLGRDADGTASGLDYAELQVSCDNRTDELRLLGNGVVPATAERAFRTLLNELNP